LRNRSSITSYSWQQEDITPYALENRQKLIIEQEQIKLRERRRTMRSQDKDKMQKILVIA